jgi:hypothetical protein
MFITKGTLHLYYTHRVKVLHKHTPYCLLMFRVASALQCVIVWREHAVHTKLLKSMYVIYSELSHAPMVL